MCRFRNALLVLAVAGFVPAAHADLILNSVYDASLNNVFQTDEQIIGLTTVGGLELYTDVKLFKSPAYDGSLSFENEGLDWSPYGVHLSSNSFVAANPADTTQVFVTGQLPRGGPLLYTFTLSYSFDAEGCRCESASASFVNTPFGPSGATGIAADSTGAVYLAAGSQIEKFTTSTDTSPSLTFGTTGDGTLSSPGALAFGPDGNLYVIDTGNNRIARFDTGGNYLGSIPLTPGSFNTTAMAIGANGWLYTANGDGGGSIYDIFAGERIGSLASTTGTGDTLGQTLLAVGGDNIYLYDQTTGLHVFDDGAEAPEPATWTLLAIALGGILLKRSPGFPAAPFSRRRPM